MINKPKYETPTNMEALMQNLSYLPLPRWLIREWRREIIMIKYQEKTASQAKPTTKEKK